MAGLRLAAFAGKVPMLNPQLLAENQAQEASNCDIRSRGLRPLRSPQVVATLSLALTDAKSIYRLSDTTNDYWLAWLKDVDVLRSPIASDALGRVYFTGDGEPRVSSFAMATLSSPYPAQFYALGIPEPTAAPTVTPSGGTGAATSRSYVYTFVSQWGEESGPSPATAVIIGKVDDTWAVTAMQTAPANSGGISAITYSGLNVTATSTVEHFLRVGDEITVSGVTTVTNVNGTWAAIAINGLDVTFAVTVAPTGTYNNATDTADTWTRVAGWNTTGLTKRLYRTQSTTFLLVATGITATSYNDTVADTALAEQLPTLGWEPPPGNMHSLTELPGGTMAGISGNEICFCEPYYPHSWPSKYRQSMSWDGVGLAAFGYTLVAMTTAYPYVLSGSHPDNMSMSFASKEALPCVAKRGIVSMDASVFYPSVNGYVVVSPAGAGTATANLYTHDEWVLLNPSSMSAGVFDRRIYLSYQVDATTGGMLTLNLQDGDLIDNNIQVSSTYTDPERAKLYVVQGNHVGEFDADEAGRMVMSWTSKEFVLASPVNLGACRVDAEFTQSAATAAVLLESQTAAIAANAALLAGGDLLGGFNDKLLNVLPVNGDILGDVPGTTYDSLQIGLIANGVEMATVTVGPDDKAFSLPSGYKEYRYAVRISGTVKVNSVTIAETMLGLKQA